MNPSFGIEVGECDGALIVRVMGELDLATSPLLHERLTLAEVTDAAKLRVDLDQVEFMDSTGLHVLLEHVLVGNGTRYSLTRGSPQVRQLFETTGLADRLPFD
jgi:anti-sigma B factor antagonist